MRDPSRIYPLLYKIGDLWVKHPDLRFGQLIEIIRSQKTLKKLDMFNIKDEDFEKLIDSYDKNPKI